MGLTAALRMLLSNILQEAVESVGEEMAERMALLDRMVRFC